MSANQRFFDFGVIAVVANTDLGPFPKDLVDELQQLDKTVVPVDIGGSRYVSGDEAFPSLLDAPNKPRIEGVIVSLPRHRVDDVVAQMEELKLTHLWLQRPGSPQTLARCKELGIQVYEADAHAYTRPGFSFSKLMLKLSGRY